MSRIQSTLNDSCLHGILVFAFGFIVVFTLYAGLPFDFHRDLILQEPLVQSMSYGELLQLTVNPSTPAWFFMDEIGYLRPIYYLIRKSFFALFGPSLYPIHAAAAIGHGVLLTTFFVIAAIVTSKKRYGWLVALLYASVPTNAPMMLGYLAITMQYWLSVMSIGALACFAYLTWQHFPKTATRVGLILLWIGFTWIAIKWKSQSKILPIITLAFLVLRASQVRQRIGIKMIAGLLVLNLLMFVLVVPIRFSKIGHTDYGRKDDAIFYNVFTSKDRTMFDIDLTNVTKRIFVAPGGENPLTAPVVHNMPNTLTGNLGFFLGWFFWLTLLTMPILIRTFKKKRVGNIADAGKANLLTHTMMMTIFYFLIMTLSFASGADVADVRFIDLALVPAIILIPFLIRLVDEAIGTRRNWQFLFRFFLYGAFVIAMVQNSKFLTKWVLYHGGFHHAHVESEKEIYRRVFHEEPHALDLYLRPHEAAVIGWHEQPADWFAQSLEKLLRKNVLYFETDNVNDERPALFMKEGFQVKKIGAYSMNDARPPIFSLYKWLSSLGIGRLKIREIHLYEMTTLGYPDVSP